MLKIKSNSLQLFHNLFDPKKPTNMTPNFENIDKWGHFDIPFLL